MLDVYFCPRVVQRLQRDADAGILEGFLGYLHSRGHGRLPSRLTSTQRSCSCTGFAGAVRPFPRLTKRSSEGSHVGVGHRAVRGRTSMRPCVTCSGIFVMQG